MIQNQILNYLIQSGDSSFLLLNNLSEDFFSDFKDEFNFISSHYNEYRTIPDKETFLYKFPNFNYFEVGESPSYLINKLYEDKNFRELTTVLNKMRSVLMAEDYDAAVKLFSEANDKLQSSKHLESVSIIKDTSRFDAYAERTQDFGKYYVKTGFDELDAVIGGWDREDELATIVARTNQGKCLAKGTKVLMADGSVKCVEDIVVGDIVQSLNRSNMVVGTHSGVSNGFRITPNVGEPFVVSSNHILTVAVLDEKWNSDRKQAITDGTFSLVDVTVEDYLKWSSHKKHISKLYRPSIEYCEKEQLIPPYILGCWLGDGTSREVSITTMDEVIVNEWKSYALSNGMSVTVRNNGSKASSYYITYKKGVQNLVLNNFRKYNLLNNKHIPMNYLTGSKEQRLELLAGLIDTDGHLQRNGTSYEITFKSIGLIEQVAQLCMSLGLKVGQIQRKFNKRYNREYFRINISGPTNIIPVRIGRKMSAETHKQMKAILTGFNVDAVEVVEYYGFECDGDHRFMLADGTLTHNSWVLLKTALAAAEQGLNVGIYSGEMSVRKVGYRIDTLFGHISNSSMIHGNFNIYSEYEKYIKSLKDGAIKGDIKVLTPDMISGPAGVTALRAFIEKEKLDMLCVDQHSLLEDDRKARSPVDKAANISRDLKNLQVMTRIPIISVSQQNRNSTEDGIDTTHIAQSDRIGQDSTVILAFHQDGKVLTMTLIKSRDSEVGKKLQYAIDLDKGLFTYIPSQTDAASGNNKLENLKSEFYEDYERDEF